MSGIWQLIFIAVAIRLAAYLHKLPWLRSIQLPDALTAGILLALFYNLGQGYAQQAWQLELPKDWLKPMVGHLLNVFYIALTLNSSCLPKNLSKGLSGGPASAEKGKASDIRGTVLFILWHYGAQAFIGLATAMFLGRYFFPGLPAAIGLFVPLGYALGPAQAYEIGSRWQDAAGQSFGDIGLSFGALGYFWATLGGLLVLNLFRKNRGQSRGKSSVAALRAQEGRGSKEGRGFAGFGRSENLQGLDAYSLALIEIFLCYGLALLFIEALGLGLCLLRPYVDLLGLMPTFRSISFVFCVLAALCFQWGRRKINTYKMLLYSRGWGEKSLRGRISSGGSAEQDAAEEASAQMCFAERRRCESLKHFCNIFVNVMVCAGIGSVSFALLWEYVAVIAVLALLGVVLLTPLHFLAARYFFCEERLERSLVIYGGMMGTTSTGMALLGVLDPYYESAAARDYLLATGFAFVGLLPVIASLYWIDSGQNWWALGLYAVYVLLTSALIVRRIRRNRV